MAALKFNTNKDLDNIETIKGLDLTLKEWFKTISLPFDGFTTQIENLEFKRRDGFIPHRHNCGVVDLITITDIRGLVGSGEHMGLSIEGCINDQNDQAHSDVQKEHPDLKQDSNEYYELVDDQLSGEYNCIAWRIRAMYEGSGVLRIYAGYDKDAPYFRWRGATQFETEIKFKTIAGLKKQLKALTSKLIKKGQ